MAGIGRDLLDLPFAELVRNLAIAIADGQTALDRSSIETLKSLVRTEVDVIADITEIIEPLVHDVDVSVPDGRGGTRTEKISVTGARVTASGAEPIKMNMVQAGLLPTFYQFTEASIEVKLSITMREERDAQASTAPAKTGGLFGLGASRAYASSVDYRTASKYSYQATGASVLRATMRPVPPPSRLEATVITVNTMVQPPSVTRTP
jgi:hypothetical protein